MTTTDTLLADLADVLDRASKLAAQMAETLGARPSYHPERDGTLSEVEPGDRVMTAGVWVEAAHVDVDGEVITVTDTTSRKMCGPRWWKVRIQKRSTPDDTPSMDYRTGDWEIVDRPGPPREMRLPGGGVAYQTIRAGEVVPGMWVAAFRPFDQWRQVTAVRATGPDEARFEYGDELETFELDDKVKVASTVDGARMAAERKAMQAEAYDQACEARS